MYPTSEVDVRATATGSDVGASGHRISTEEVMQDDDNDPTGLGIQTSRLQDVPVDTRIRWVYFMLGAATLVSWNGMSLVLEPANEYEPSFTSINQCESVFHFATVRISTTGTV